MKSLCFWFCFNFKVTKKQTNPTTKFLSKNMGGGGWDRNQGEYSGKKNVCRRGGGILTDMYTESDAKHTCVIGLYLSD